MDMPFKDKVALVTGAAEGTGFFTAKAFAAVGASVVLVDIQADKVRSTAETLTILWLCSPGASFAIGYALIVDGGFTVH